MIIVKLIENGSENKKEIKENMKYEKKKKI